MPWSERYTLYIIQPVNASSMIANVRTQTGMVHINVSIAFFNSQKIPFHPFRWVKNLSDVSLLERKCRLCLNLWQYRLWSFQRRDTKLGSFLAKNYHAQRKVLNFANWCSREVSKSTKIWLFYVKNHRNLSDFFFHWRIQT